MKMKRGIQFVLLLTISMVFNNCQKESTDILYDKKYIKEIKEVRKEAILYLSRNFIPGGTFAIAKEGKIIYSEGMGLASKDLDVHVNRETKFRIGDVSELFTSLIYQQMVANGILHPDSTVQYYIPDFPEKEYKLPIHQLTYHSSGIREPNNLEYNLPGINVSLQKGIESFKNDPLIAPPGLYESPSIYNFNLLGAIMEKATNKRFPAILKEYLTDTLNLSNTLIDNPFLTIKGRSAFYEHNYISQVVNATFYDLRYRAPAQGILSNAEDLVKLGNAILYSELITDEIKAKLFQPKTLYNDILSSSANGWMLLEDMNGEKLYGKRGNVAGGGAAILIFPEEKLVVAAAINLTDDTDDIPVFKIASAFLTNPDEKETEKK